MVPRHRSTGVRGRRVLAAAEGAGFTMVTCDPSTLVEPIHPKGMITILAPDDIDTWLRGSYDEIVALQRPYDPAQMTVRGPVFPTRRKER